MKIHCQRLRFMTIMLHGMKCVKPDSGDLDAEFEMKDKEHKGTPKKFEKVKLLDLFNESPTRMLQDLSTALNVDISTLHKRLCVQKGGNWIPYQLKKKEVWSQQKRVLYIVLLQTTKNGFTKATLNDTDKGEELVPK